MTIIIVMGMNTIVAIANCQALYRCKNMVDTFAKSARALMSKLDACP